MAIWSILRPFGTFMAIWYSFFRFGMVYQKKLASLTRVAGWFNYKSKI
jgi:hypothetical protein